MKKTPPKPTITVDTDPELLASAIVEVSQSAKKLLASRLTEKAVLLLVSHASGVSQRECKRVLEAAGDLHLYVKKPAKKSAVDYE
jgi:hypothetical protein